MLTARRHQLALIGGVLLAAIAAQSPVRAAEPPLRARVGAFLTHLGDLNEKEQRFDVQAWLWFVYPATTQAVDLAKTIEVTNAIKTDKAHLLTEKTPQGIWSQVKLQAIVQAQLTFESYPFDRHTLTIFLEDTAKDSRQLVFVPDVKPGAASALGVSPELPARDFAVTRLSLTVAPHRAPTDYGDPTLSGASEYSRVTLTVQIARQRSARLLFALLLGTLVALLLAGFATQLPIQQSPPRYGLIVGAFFVAITNRLLVDAKLPPSSSLGVLDQMQLAAMAAIGLLTAVSLVLTNLAEKRMEPARASRLSRRFGVVWLLGVLALEAAMVLPHALR